MKPLLIVDGYNVIGAWSEAEKKGWSLDESRDRLMRQLEDYAGFSGEEILLVFDGYQSERTTTTEEKHGDLTLIFTRHGETADSYIERAAAQTRAIGNCASLRRTGWSNRRCCPAARSA